MRQTLLYILFALTLTFCNATDGMAGKGIFSSEKTPDYYEANVRELFRHNKWTEGKRLLDEAWPDYGTMSVLNELMGKYYYHYKKYDKARFHLVRALRDDYTNTQAREILVNVEEETGNYSSAICYINELLDNNPYSRGWWRRKINCYRKMGNHVEANRLLVRLQQIYPQDEVVKKDVAYVNEQKLAKARRDGDMNTQIESLQNLLKSYPSNVEYYLMLCNAYLQTGRYGEALETAGRGANITNSTELIKKRAGILSEQGRYTEAISYLKAHQKNGGASITSMINSIEEEAAAAAQLNDPYTAMARVYSRNHSGEALKYLLNTAIARGYYDDALEYIAAAKKGGKQTDDLLYKEYLVNHRLGNDNTARACLNKLYARNPNNSDTREALSEMRYKSATELMNLNQYGEAVPELLFVEENAVEPELKKSAMMRLFNCYFETKRYQQAQELLDRMNSSFSYDNYITQKATLLKEQGQVAQAMQLLANEYAKSTSEEQRSLLAYQYEEYAIPFIKDMMSKGMTRQADKAVKQALQICPTSNELLHQALTTSGLLGNYKDYDKLVETGRENYPEDPFFIVKEASILSRNKNYKGAMDLLRPELDTYIGDSTLVAAYCENARSMAVEQAKAKAYNSAISTINEALAYNHEDRELLYTKGIIYEQMHNYDSAYVYQKFYRPTLMDYREHSRHLEELQAGACKNMVTIMYQQARPGEEDVISANAFATYTRKEEHDSWSVVLGYAGRDGVGAENMNKEMISGGTGVQIGGDWEHDIKDTPWKFGVGARWASKYFPQITLNANIEYEWKNDWTFGVHGSYRRMHTYRKYYEWDEDPENPTGDSIYIMKRWTHVYNRMLQGGITVQKVLERCHLQAGVDLCYIAKGIYYNVQAKGQFFPVEGSRTHVYATAGIGTAPQTELLDSSLPAGFSKLNSFVGGGLYWVFNKFIGLGLSGTWYTMYRSQSIETGIWGAGNTSIITSSSKTDYKNMYYVQAELQISF